jgi:hypothetical protein
MQLGPLRVGGKNGKEEATKMFPNATVKFGSVGETGSIRDAAFNDGGYDVVVGLALPGVRVVTARCQTNWYYKDFTWTLLTTGRHKSNRVLTAARNNASGKWRPYAAVSCLASRTGGIKDSWDIDYQATKNVLDVVGTPYKLNPVDP